MELIDVLNNFNIKPHKIEYYEEAFTHSSYANEVKNGVVDYERIEFIGDGVLDLIVADLIFNLYPTMSQGIMTKLRAQVVCSSTLASYSKKLGFGEIIKLGKGQIKEGANQKILEDVFESFIGATYLDQGYDFVKELITKIVIDDIKHFDIDLLTDYKSKLQELLQANYRGNIKYEVINETGPAQDKTFYVEVYMVMLDKSVLKSGKGSGKNMKLAEEDAARDALTKKAGI